MSLKRVQRLPSEALLNLASLFSFSSKRSPPGHEDAEDVGLRKVHNPIQLLTSLTGQQWASYLVAWGGWIFDSYDFSVLTIQTAKFAKYYHVDKTHITDAITLTLLFRLIGALIFGVLGDFYGRKWPFAVNMWLLGVLQIATIYTQTYGSFLAVRSLFGVAMGGIFGSASAMALENMPVEARGLLGGVFAEGFSLGYIIAAVGNLIVGGAPTSWKPLFWFGAAGSFLFGVLRLFLPESRQFLEAKSSGKRGQSTRHFRRNALVMLKMHWPIYVYCTILATILMFWGHTATGSYTTFMLTGKQMKNGPASRASIIMKTGAVVGGATGGYISQCIGRRRAIVLSAFTSALMIPAWILPNSFGGLAAGGFFLQFFIGGVFGVVPSHLQELSPANFRAVFAGMAYQLGNAISSPATQVVNELAEHHYKAIGPDGKTVDGYAPVMGVATGLFATLMMIWAAMGPERTGSHFERAAVAGASQETISSSESNDLAKDQHEQSQKTQLHQTVELAELSK